MPPQGWFDNFIVLPLDFAYRIEGDGVHLNRPRPMTVEADDSWRVTLPECFDNQPRRMNYQPGFLCFVGQLWSGVLKKVLFEYMAVGVGGLFGSMARFFVARLFTGSPFPVGTMLINLSGSLFLGWFATVAGNRLPISQDFRLAIAVGFTGAYTTFSTYMFESNSMLSDGAGLRAMFYLLGSLLLGLLAVRAGVILGHRMNG